MKSPGRFTAVAQFDACPVGWYNCRMEFSEGQHSSFPAPPLALAGTAFSAPHQDMATADAVTQPGRIRMRYRMVSMVLVLVSVLVSAGAQASDLDAVKTLIGKIRVQIEHQGKLDKAADATKPPRKSESWEFKAGGTNPTVRYVRYLNLPPDFTGTYHSLANHDMGIGLDGGSFRYWYSGNAIRVLLDGKDIFAERRATRIETQESANGHVRLVWELENNRRIVLTFTVPKDGRAVFARVDIDPGTSPTKRIELKLNCYPGGYGPAYKQPSHRYVKTAKASGEVPRDFERTPAKGFPVVPFSAGEEWILYGDKLASSGSLGLLVNRAENPSGQVSLSSYGVVTSLVYPQDAHHIHLAFFAYSLENEPAQKAFLAELDKERTALITIPFWTDKN